MRIAISTDGGYVSPHFGRCPTFTLLDIDDGKTISRFEISNPGHEPGLIPDFLNRQGVVKIVCGGMGSRAKGFFEELGIEAVTGVDCTIDEAVHLLESGTLSGGEGTCFPGGGKGYGIDKKECDHSDDNSNGHDHDDSHSH
ncbi:MAG: NifB/NifX family molybdenum-iron cluster-binding protein [Eubacteriales bacterium]|nr:NifB/NifX family molybdenum-iron cluster-binding protein [Eubacteriales bacterium]